MGEVTGTGNYQMNDPATLEGGDANSFRIPYLAGTFSASGEYPVTIEATAVNTNLRLGRASGMSIRDKGLK